MQRRISIVIPNYNGEQFLAECLDSVVSQNYAGLDLVVIDGGSTDVSPAIIGRYSKHIAVTLSERDKGQSDAVNKGLALATGEIVAYLNSDDVLEPGSLAKVNELFLESPEMEWLAGGCRVFGPDIATWYLHPEGWKELADTLIPWSRSQRFVFPQSGAAFMTMDLVRRLGEYDAGLHYSMDMEYYARAAFAGSRMQITPDVLAGWRWHDNTKSSMRGFAYGFRSDEVRILLRYLPFLPPGEHARAQREANEQQWLVLVREANFWTEQGERDRSLGLLYDAARMRPSVLTKRPWLGGLRRALSRQA